MTIPDRPGGTYLADENGQAALRSLTAIERMACARLIARQFAYWSKIPRIVADYGLEGTVRLCSARSILLYLVGIGVIAVGFAIAGLSAVAIPGFVLVFLLAFSGAGRLISAVRSGRRWRDRRPGPAG
jgi:hypothetical protein